MIINIVGIELTELGSPKVDMLILHNCLSVALISWAEIENLTSGKFCSISYWLCTADCQEDGNYHTLKWRTLTLTYKKQQKLYSAKKENYVATVEVIMTSLEVIIHVLSREGWIKGNRTWLPSSIPHTHSIDTTNTMKIPNLLISLFIYLLIMSY